MAKDTQKRDVIIIGAGMAGLTAALYSALHNWHSKLSRRNISCRFNFHSLDL